MVIGVVALTTSEYIPIILGKNKSRKVIRVNKVNSVSRFSVRFCSHFSFSRSPFRVFVTFVIKHSYLSFAFFFLSFVFFFQNLSIVDFEFKI